MPVDLQTLPTMSRQAERLIALDIHQMSGLPAAELRAAVSNLDSETGLLVVHPEYAPASTLAPLLKHGGKQGFVVVDMSDVDSFTPIGSVTLPGGPVYVVEGLERGDHMANWSPNEALAAITAAGRTPLTLTEGIQWVLQQPGVLERNHCFMTIGSRRVKDNGSLDARTPALWISNGTGRDGRENRNAPKVGWCWAGNRHTWLSFASGARRRN